MTHKTSEFYEASDLKQRVLALMAKHMRQLELAEKLVPQDGTTLQNYLKALIFAEKDEREKLSQNDPRKMSDEELLRLADEAKRALSHETNDQTYDGVGQTPSDIELFEDLEDADS